LKTHLYSQLCRNVAETVLFSLEIVRFTFAKKKFGSLSKSNVRSRPFPRMYISKTKVITYW
jgi:hypothetical protein